MCICVFYFGVFVCIEQSHLTSRSISVYYTHKHKHTLTHKHTFKHTQFIFTPSPLTQNLLPRFQALPDLWLSLSLSLPSFPSHSLSFSLLFILFFPSLFSRSPSSPLGAPLIHSLLNYRSTFEWYKRIFISCSSR